MASSVQGHLNSSILNASRFFPNQQCSNFGRHQIHLLKIQFLGHAPPQTVMAGSKGTRDLKLLDLQERLFFWFKEFFLKKRLLPPLLIGSNSGHSRPPRLYPVKQVLTLCLDGAGDSWSGTR